jgi:hypothetical protein
MMSSHTKAGAWLASTLLCGMLAAAPAAIAQAPKEPPPKAKGAQGPELPSSTIAGNVTRYLITPMGDVEGLVLDTGTVARLPMHMGKDLVEVVKVGDAVSIEGVKDDQGTAFRAYSITDIKTKQIVVRRDKTWTEVTLPKSLRSLGLKELTANGAVQTILTGPQGETQGVILDNGTIVRFGKDAVYAASAQMKIGAKLAAKGFGTENEYGRAIDAASIGETPETMKTIVR